MEAAFGARFWCFVLLLVFTDLYLLGIIFCQRIGIPVPRHLPMGLDQGLICIALAFGIYGTWARCGFRISGQLGARLPNLPLPCVGMNIVQLTRLHVGPILKKDWVLKLCGKVNAIEPDIVS